MRGQSAKQGDGSRQRLEVVQINRVKVGETEHQVAIYDFEPFDAINYHPLIANTRYDDPLMQEGKHFPRGLSFVNVTFRKRVDFSHATFDGPAYFWNCRFEERVSFFHAKVQAGCPVHDRLDGELNFSYSHFSKFSCADDPESDTDYKVQPSFDRAEVDGPAFFHRTTFADGVTAEEARFSGEVRFNGFLSDICVSQEQLQNVIADDAIRVLLSSNIIGVNQDHSDHYDFNKTIRSKTGFRKRLESAHSSWSTLLSAKPQELTEEQQQQLASLNSLTDLWNGGFNKSMFNGCGGEISRVSSFRRAFFGEHTVFTQVSLGRCLFQGANVSSLKFLAVDWQKQPCGLVLRHVFRNYRRVPWFRYTYRAALQDEFRLDEDAKNTHDRKEMTSRRKELSELYRELRVSYDREGDSLLGRDFYFGEQEAERLSFGRVKKFVGLANLYRVFSGYSKREGLALGWLLFFIFILFPLLFQRLINTPEKEYLSIPLRQGSPLPVVNRREAASSTPELGIAVCRVPLPANALMVEPRGGTQPSQDHGPMLREEAKRYTGVVGRAIRSSWGRYNPDWIVRAVGGTHPTVAAWIRTWALTSYVGVHVQPSILLRALGPSLQASTFFPASMQRENSIESSIALFQSIRCDEPQAEQEYNTAAGKLIGLETHRRALEGLERLIVPSQLALFLLAVRSRFQRTA